MSDTSINSRQRYILNGQTFNAPIDWQDVSIVANYENDNVQPSLTIDEFRFPLEARVIINKWVTDGLLTGVGIFEGMPLDLSVYNNSSVQHNFKSFIDFTKGYKDFLEEGILDVGVIKNNSVDNFFDQVGSTTYGYLEEIGVFNDGSYTQVSYVVEKKFNLIELIIANVVFYLMVKELAEAIERTTSAIAEVTALITGGSVLPPTASLGAALLAVLKAIILIAYTAVLIVAITELGKALLESLLPKERKHKALVLRDALSAVCDHFGYSFDSDIPELSTYYYLPSNPNLDAKTLGGFISETKGTQSGIPNVLDYGYRCEDMFELCKRLFNAKIAIVGNTVQLRSRNAPYWIQQSQWELPSVIIETLEYNTEEMKAERLLSFEADLNDEWTIDNYFGTAYEIRTEPITVIRQNAVLLKGLDDVNFNVALGNRKEGLSGLENFLKDVASAIDGVANFFGGDSNLVGEITTRIGVMKQSSNWHSVPKLIPIVGGKIPNNHRDVINAKLLYDKYHNEKSFVLNNFGNQKRLYKQVRVPFGFNDYGQLTENSYFKYNGSVAKITKFEWIMGEDTALIDFWVKNIYTKNLKERYINPE